MKINDILLIIVLLLFSFIPLAFINRSAAKIAVVSVNNEHYKTVSLDKDAVLTVKTKYGENIVKIENNTVAVESADCADKICVRSGKIENAGEVIACLPHRLLIEVKEDD
ncbi:MAG: NusG domain II-containing protein [Selenomonadaceae bacterium]|nr:NusG domain II-containing protein [Selenomonadaceae bacterium]